MQQLDSSTPPKEKHLNHFWVTLSVFVIAGLIVSLLASKTVGFIVPVLFSVVFSVAVFNLPRVIDSQSKHVRILRMYCTVGSVIVFVCFTGIIVISVLKTIKTYHFEHLRSIEVAISAVYFATSLIISKRFDKDEKRIAKHAETTKSHTRDSLHV